jgi:antitoxin (DNA-binding transcriptional repressor) of toxin-antitoxin stability system
MHINQYACMVKNLPISKARVNLGAVVRGVREKGDVIVLEKDGIPVASIVGVDVVEDMRDALDIAAARLKTAKEAMADWDAIRARYV